MRKVLGERRHMAYSISDGVRPRAASKTMCVSHKNKQIYKHIYELDGTEKLHVSFAPPRTQNVFVAVKRFVFRISRRL
jgi:hypothetical protein